MSGRSEIRYNPDTHELLLDIAYEPAVVGSQNHSFVDADFYGIPVPQDGKAIPGPFQNLEEGRNSYIVWEGLKIPEKGKLPDPGDF